MQLLFDQNLSPKLVKNLADIFPGSLHVQDIGFHEASDNEIWEYAKLNKLAIVTKDSDFHEKLILFRSLPNIIWIRRGNCSTNQIEFLLQAFRDQILQLDCSEPGYLIIR